MAATTATKVVATSMIMTAITTTMAAIITTATTAITVNTQNSSNSYDGYNNHNDHDGHYNHNLHSGINPTNLYSYTSYIHYKQPNHTNQPFGHFLWADRPAKAGVARPTPLRLGKPLAASPRELLFLENFSS